MRNTSQLKSDQTLGGSGQLGGGGQLIPHKSLGSRKRLKARSEKKSAWFREKRAPFVADYLKRHPYCAFRLWVHPTTIEESPALDVLTRNTTHCSKRADDVHELFPQGRGGNAVPIDGQDEDEQFRGLCRFHHTFVTSRPAWAREKGYTR